jgi:site-specific DNA recombinase
MNNPTTRPPKYDGNSRAVIYCRVSTKEQTENLSLATQEKQCREYCARYNATVDKVFVEQGESAKTTDRTQFREMLKYCRENKGRITQVVVYSISRFARSVCDHLDIRKQLSALGISLRSVTEAFDDSSQGKLMESILASFAQFDNDLRAERTVTGMKAAIEKGRWPFKPPIGYVCGGKACPSMLPDPERAPLIRLAFESFATGLHKPQQVLEQVTKRGLRTSKGKMLSLQSFTQLLRKPAYAGWIVVRGWGEPVRGDFQAIVPQETFDVAQAILAGKRLPATAYQRNHPDFPLRQFVKCGSCGKPLTGSFSTGRAKRRYGYYHCQNGGCKGTSVKRSDLESQFMEYLKRLQPRPAYVKLFKEVVLDVWRLRQQHNLTLSVSLERKISDLRAKRERLDEVFIYEKAIDHRTYESQKHKLGEDLLLAEMERREAATAECDIEGVLNFAEHVMLNASRLWAEFSLEQKQRFQRLLFPQGVRFQDGEFGTDAISPVFNGLQPSENEKQSLATLTGIEPVPPP